MYKIEQETSLQFAPDVHWRSRRGPSAVAELRVCVTFTPTLIFLIASFRVTSVIVLSYYSISIKRTGDYIRLCVRERQPVGALHDQVETWFSEQGPKA